MEVRDAVEEDADVLAEHADLPRSAVAQIVHDRTVRVAVPNGGGEDAAGGEGGAAGGDYEPDVAGFVAFDAATDVVHVTQLAGDSDVVVLLLDEPVGFAEREGMAVEVLVPESESDLADAVEAYGFADDGAGPRFEGEATRRYRFDP